MKITYVEKGNLPVAVFGDGKHIGIIVESRSMLKIGASWFTFRPNVGANIGAATLAQVKRGIEVAYDQL